jgi:Protein of unknown function (DUF3363)
VLASGTAFEPFEGIVRAKGLHDELGGEMFVAVESLDRTAYYIRLRPEVADPLREGDTVRITSPTESWVKASDRIIARAALQNAGVYDPALHQRALEIANRAAPARPGPTPGELVAANLRRLERLERYGLATRLAKSCWRVPGDLVAQLESRERTHPRHRIQIDRLGREHQVVRKRGPEMSR